MGRCRGSRKTTNTLTQGTAQAADPLVDGNLVGAQDGDTGRQGDGAGQRQLDVDKETGWSLGVLG